MRTTTGPPISRSYGGGPPPWSAALRTATPDSGGPSVVSQRQGAQPERGSCQLLAPSLAARDCPAGLLELKIRNERRRTGRRRTVDHVANRPPNVRHLFDGSKELRTGRPRQRARREPNVAVVGA